MLQARSPGLLSNERDALCCSEIDQLRSQGSEVGTDELGVEFIHCHIQLQVRQSDAASQQDSMKEKQEVVEKTMKEQARAIAAEGDEKARQDLSEQLQNAKMESRRWEESFQKAKEGAAQQEEALQREKSALEHLQLQVSEAIKGRSLAESARDKLQEKLEVVEKTLKEQAGALAAEGDEKARHLQAALAELQKSNSELEQARQDLSEQLQNAKMESRRWEESFQKAKGSAAQQEEALQREKSALEHLQLQVSEAIKGRSLAESARDKLQEKLEVVEKTLKEQAGALAAEGDEKARHLQAALAELQKSNSELEQARQDLSEQLQNAKMESRRWEESFQKAKGSAAQQEEALQREKSALEHLQLQVSEAIKGRSLAESARDKLQEKLEVVEKTLKEQAGALAAEGDEKARHLQAALAELQKSNSELEQARQDLSEQLQNAKMESRRWEESFQKAEEGAAQQEEALQREKSALEHLQLQVSEAIRGRSLAESARDKLQEKLEVVEKTLKEQAGALAAEGDEKARHLQAALAEVQKSNSELEQARQDLSEQLQNAKMESRRWEESFQKAKEGAAQQEEALQREKSALEHLQLQVSEAIKGRSLAESEQDKMKEHLLQGAQDEHVQHLQAGCALYSDVLSIISFCQPACSCS